MVNACSKIHFHNCRVDVYKRQPVTLIDRWSREFENNKCIFIEDMEDLRSQSPEEYEVLSSQNIKRLIAAPLFSNQRLAGYIGVDNPPGDLFDQVEAFLETLSYFLSSSMEQMRTYRVLKDLSYLDTLTGLYNRNRFNEDLDRFGRQEMCIRDRLRIGICILSDNAARLLVFHSGYLLYISWYFFSSYLNI